MACTTSDRQAHTRSAPVSFTAPATLAEAIERAAAAELLSVSTYCRRAVLRELVSTGFHVPEGPGQLAGA